MALPSTKACRQALADILGPLLLAPAGPAEALFAYRTADFNQKSPVVVITTHRARPHKEVRQAFWGTREFLIVSMARYSSPASEEAAENVLDVIDDIIIDTLGGDEHQVNALWSALDLLQDQRDSIQLGGADYRHSLFVVTLEVYPR
jgi:hypothetical protein